MAEIKDKRKAAKVIGKTVKRETSARDAIAAAQEAIAQAQAQIKAAERQAKEEARREDRQRKILIGAMHLYEAESDERKMAALLARLDKFLIRECDREYFDLPSSEEAKQKRAELKNTNRPYAEQSNQSHVNHNQIVHHC